MSRIPAVRIHGHYDDKSGYSRFRRELALALANLGAEVQLAGSRAPRFVGENSTSVERARAMTREIDARYAVHIDTPDRSTPDPNRVNILFSQVEADRIPTHWAALSQAYDLVVVPTQAAEAAWVRGGYPRERIRRCPQGVAAEIFAAEPTPNPALLAREVRGRPLGSYATRFLNVSDTSTRHRENLGGLIGTWLAATDARDNAVLVVKWFDPYGPAAAQQVLDATVANASASLGKHPDDAAPIMLLTDWYAEEAMPGMYAAFTHYLTVSHGEGWDLPMAEAGAAGLRLIAPDHSAYRAYLSERIATLLPSTLAPVHPLGWGADPADLRLGIHWWETDLEAAADAIRDAINGRDRHRPLARETILRDFSWARAAEQFAAILVEFDASRRITPAEVAAADVLPDPLADPEAASNHLAEINDLIAREIAWERGADNWQRLPALRERIAPLQRALVEGTRVMRRHDLGAQPAAPVLSVVVSLHTNLDYLEPQLAAMSGAGPDGPLEILYVLDGPEAEREALAALRGLHERLGVSCRLLVTNRNAGYSTVNNLGAAEARADHLLFLNSDAWPERPGWLAPLLAAADLPGTGLVQPLVVGLDGALQSAGQAYHPGLAFGLWDWQPVHQVAGNEPAAVPGVYGAAILTRRDVWQRLGGFCADYVVTQFDDVDLSNRARQAGLQNRVVPTVTFLHGAGKTHTGPQRLRQWLHNAWVHHQTWDAFLTREAAGPTGRPKSLLAAAFRDGAHGGGGEVDTAGLDLTFVDSPRLGRIHGFANDTFILPSIRETGYWEWTESHLIEERVRPGMNVLDVGAFIGYHARLFASLLQGNGTVLSIEADPETYRVLRLNTRDLPEGTVETLNIAASDAAHQVVMDRVGSSHAHPGANQVIAVADGSAGATVAALPLDDVLDPEVPVHFVKVDVEGYDLRVLAGLRRTIGRWRPTVLLEWHRKNILAAGGDPLAVLRDYLAEGWRVTPMLQPEMVALMRPHGDVGSLLSEEGLLAADRADAFERLAGDADLGHMTLLIEPPLSVSGGTVYPASDLPVYLIAFDNPTYVRMMLGQLRGHGLHHIVLVDNASTYPPMLDLLAEEEARGTRLIRSPYNRGPWLLMHDDFYPDLPDLFCVTDPDLAFNPDLPADFVERLVALTERHQVGKAGFALEIADRDLMRQERFANDGVPQHIWEWEEQFWDDQVDLLDGQNPVFRADIDTTFAVYNKRYLTNVSLSGVRVAGRYTCRHLPWYRDSLLDPEEQAWYQRTAEFSTYNVAPPEPEPEAPDGAEEADAGGGTAIPVFIPTFNNPTYVRGMLRQLRDRGIADVTLIDNASTYPPMLALLDEVEASGEAEVLRLPENRGPGILFTEEVFAALPEVFAITDPDLELGLDLPPDFMTRLLGLTRRHRIGKAGLALGISDRHLMRDETFETDGVPRHIWEREAGHWQDQAEVLDGVDPVYRAALGTTFAVYNKAFYDAWDRDRALRVAGRFTARHLPWYRDTAVDPEEAAWYRDREVFSTYRLQADGSPVPAR